MARRGRYFAEVEPTGLAIVPRPAVHPRPVATPHAGALVKQASSEKKTLAAPVCMISMVRPSIVQSVHPDTYARFWAEDTNAAARLALAQRCGLLRRDCGLSMVTATQVDYR